MFYTKALGKSYIYIIYINFKVDCQIRSSIWNCLWKWNYLISQQHDLTRCLKDLLKFITFKILSPPLLIYMTSLSWAGWGGCFSAFLCRSGRKTKFNKPFAGGKTCFYSTCKTTRKCNQVASIQLKQWCTVYSSHLKLNLLQPFIQ